MAAAMRSLGPRELGFFGWLWFRARRRAVAWIRENDPVADWDERDYLASWAALRTRMRARIRANAAGPEAATSVDRRSYLQRSVDAAIAGDFAEAYSWLGISRRQR